MTARERARKIRKLNERIERNEAQLRADKADLSRLELEESHERGFFVSPLRGKRLLAEMDRSLAMAA